VDAQKTAFQISVLMSSALTEYPLVMLRMRFGFSKKYGLMLFLSIDSILFMTNFRLNYYLEAAYG
jgi:hypothetical protein